MDIPEHTDPAPEAPPVPQVAETPAGIPWENLDDTALLKWRICDLNVRIEGSVLESRVAKLHAELDAKGLRYRPPCYLATEWLCPDLVPALGIAFYLAHPRLQRLEKTMMLEAEGESESDCMRLLRHETGHTLNYAFQLFRRNRWRELFGSMRAPYDPHNYFMRPYSRQYVVHLEDYYAQAHPDEDFAETFAVWLTPESDWRERYAGWGALKKLEYVDHLMKSIAQADPIVTHGTRHWAASKTRATLETYFKQKRKEFAQAYPGFYDPVLKTLFTVEAQPAHGKACVFLNRHRKKLADAVARWARVPKYAVDHLIRRLSQRSKELNLYLRTEEKEALLPGSICLTSLVLEAREPYLRALKGKESR